ncbi:MAG: metallophosphoesterase [Nitrospina sp.]|jgi:hypothetical protein|nr:metallophosphoesterase [Nitrospina sp.]MBT3511004.1 metallophosphoesterase [Nitrospina sp.]MBT4047785.1 metallophosphoesterase [Nitrospina sp.]MBT4556113.1 metallophosphoesterase [Nitrospina sp.]MBT6739763.1 metallophosphoesterase [Nitrospina sp.]
MRFLKSPAVFLFLPLVFILLLVVLMQLEKAKERGNFYSEKLAKLEKLYSQQKEVIGQVKAGQGQLSQGAAHTEKRPHDKFNGSGDSSYSFMAVGHAYTYPDYSKKIQDNGLNQDFLRFMKSYPMADTRFVVFTGDFTSDGFPSQWDKTEEQIKDFPVDFHFVSGNHDEGVDGSEKDTFLERTGRDEFYDSFFVGEDLFVILRGAEQGSKQLDFLKKEIGKEHRYLFVFLHYIWWAREFGVSANSDVNGDGWWEEVFSLLKASGKQVFVFGGDAQRNFDIVKVENVRLISNGLAPGKSTRNTVAVVKVGKYGVDISPTPIS